MNDGPRVGGGAADSGRDVTRVLRRTRDGYDEVADLYADLFAGQLPAQPLTRAMLGAFADLATTAAASRAGAGDHDGRDRDAVASRAADPRDAGRRARVVDAGCGPGHLTAHLSGLGVDTLGVDLTPAMIERARRDHPTLPFALADMLALPVADRGLDGLVAWYSIIHLPPVWVPRVLAEFHRVLADGAPLLIAVQATDGDIPAPQPHDHRVAPSHRWPADALATLLRDAGFVESARLLHPAGPGERTPGAILLASRPTERKIVGVPIRNPSMCGPGLPVTGTP